PPQLVLYDGKMTDKLDVDKGAHHLANFLKSCTAEMQLAVQAVGKTACKELNREDLVAVDKDLASFMGVRHAASHRVAEEEKGAKSNQRARPERSAPAPLPVQ
ncbi:MAG TPA: FMN-binding glutamate synthase family protein, partial [Firmicutes bacterium]|nr:FMN-binding glutamate synthase family protein [Bacillota bacterium]